MGKRKKSSRKPQGPKKKESLPTSFKCLFCNHDQAVTVKIDRKAGIGRLTCKVCGQNFETNINYLSAAVDVYADWIDACEEVAETEAKTTTRRPSNIGARTPAAAGDTGGAGGDEFIVDDELDAEGEYADE